MSTRPGFSGTLFDRVHRVLAGQPEYDAFRAGRRSRAEFSDFLERMRGELVGHGIPANDVHFAKRFPQSIEACVRSAFDRLQPLGLELPAGFGEVHSAAALRIAHGYDHQDLSTYIYPEEGALLLALALAFRPRSAVFLGSYYGYWAAWAFAALEKTGGRAILLDPDPHVAVVSKASLERLYPGVLFDVVCSTGEDFLRDTDMEFDFVVLDAELPRDHPDPTRRGKGVYSHLLQAVLPRAPKRSLLVCHNILLRDHSGCHFFDDVIARNRQELGPFLDLVAQEYAHFVELPTTEGVGVGLRTP